jgi:hypothetical protein
MIIADEIIVFSTFYIIAIVWMFLKILVHHWLDSPTRLDKIRRAKVAA